MENTEQNQLGAGLTLEKVGAAVSLSGYPLQTRIGRKLRQLGFSISPEWSFVDRDTEELRCIDLRASKRFDDRMPGVRTRPHLDLLIECKQSQLPIVFFLEEGPQYNPQFPYLVGLASSRLTVRTDDTLDTWRMTPQVALGLHQDRFATYPDVAFTLSKCQRKGNDLILSGEETYNSIVLPIIKGVYPLDAGICKVCQFCNRDHERVVATSYNSQCPLTLPLSGAGDSRQRDRCIV